MPSSLRVRIARGLAEGHGLVPLPSPGTMGPRRLPDTWSRVVQRLWCLSSARIPRQKLPGWTLQIASTHLDIHEVERPCSSSLSFFLELGFLFSLGFHGPSYLPVHQVRWQSGEFFMECRGSMVETLLPEGRKSLASCKAPSHDTPKRGMHGAGLEHH